MNDLQTFSGKNSVLNYLDPDNLPYFPLVEIPEILNPYYKFKVRIYAKLMNSTPLLNIKSLPALNMLMEAKKDGLLKTDTIIESSSGNMAMSLGIISRLLNIKNQKVIVSNSIAQDKLQVLQLFGAQVIVNKEPMCPDKDDPKSGINLAKSLAKKNGWYNPGQYDNPNNPGAHFKWTGKQIWKQTEGKISIFASPLGTTGTMTGAGSYLKLQNSKIVNLGVVSKEDKMRLGPRTKNLLKEINFHWQDNVSEITEVSTKDSFIHSLNLCRYGILAGPSSGFTLKGLFAYLDKLIKNNQIDKYRNKDNEIIAVFVCCDTPFLYIHEYFKFIDNKQFEKIENEHFLTNSDNKIKSKKTTVAKSIKNHNLLTNINKNTILIDVRNKKDFNKFHIEKSINIEFYNLTENIDNYYDIIKNKEVFFVDCGLSVAAKDAAEIFLYKYPELKIKYLLGGMDLWMKENLPHAACNPITKRYKNVNHINLP